VIFCIIPRRRMNINGQARRLIIQTRAEVASGHSCMFPAKTSYARASNSAQ
jgi:hypothetical protein